MTYTGTALVLEDEPLIAMAVEDELTAAGFSVSTVLSCEDANIWLKANRPDIVILDILLRDGPADEVVTSLIDSKIPFIVHSGDHRDMLQGTPYAQGVWVSKPHAGDELATAARALFVSA